MRIRLSNVRNWAYLLFIPLLATRAFAACVGLDEADQFDRLEEQQAVIDHLESLIAAGVADESACLAAIEWRRARAILYLTERLEDAEDRRDVATSHPALMEGYRRAAQAAEAATAAEPYSARAWFWRGSAVAKQAQVVRSISSLRLLADARDHLVVAARLDPTLPEAWYILGSLYRRVPGFPLSFGDVDSAVSYGRAALAIGELAVARGQVATIRWDVSIELAGHLATRGWSARRRQAVQDRKGRAYRNADDVVERYQFFEAVVDLGEESDRSEAMVLVSSALHALEAIEQPTATQRRDLAAARALIHELDQAD